MYSLHYEKFNDGSVKCIEDEITFELPEGWAWCRVRNIASVKGGKRLPKGMSFSDITTDHAYIRVTDMKNRSINTTGLKYISDEVFSTIKAYIISRSDLYVTIAGTIGMVGEVPDELDGMNLTENAVKVCNISINKTYLCYVMLSQFVQEQFRDKTHQVAMPKLALERILSTLIPIAPIHEQAKVAQGIENSIKFVDMIDSDKEDLGALVSNVKAKILDLAIRGQLVPQSPDDEPASVLLERIRAEKEKLIKAGKIKRDKKESVIFKGEDNSYYEKVSSTINCIDDEIPFDIPDTWTWMRLENCCKKEIRRGKSPKYIEKSNTLVFAQKCNKKNNDIDISLALCLDESTLKKYSADEYMCNGDIVINSTGTGTLGRVGYYRTSDNLNQLPIVPDSHVTVIRGYTYIQSFYLYLYMKANQFELEKKGEGSTNQKELKPLTLKEMLVPIPPHAEQEKICNFIDIIFTKLSMVEKSLS